MAVIIVKQESSFWGFTVGHDVYLNTLDHFVGQLKNGGVLEIPVEVGTHTLSFRAFYGKKSTPEDITVFHVIVNEPHEVVELKMKVRSGRLLD